LTGGSCGTLPCGCGQEGKVDYGGYSREAYIEMINKPADQWSEATKIEVDEKHKKSSPSEI
jgi:hypothetical protein